MASVCIFCPGVLDRHTKPEHVLLNALGGRKTTTQVICSACNNQFGKGIDKAHADQVDVIRNLLNMQSGSGKLAPMLRKVQAGAEVLNIRGDGTFEPVTKPFIYKQRPGGSFEVEINAGSLEEIKSMVPHLAAALGMREEQIRDQLPAARARVVERRPDTIHFSLAFGGHDAIRSAAKACLVLWTLRVGRDEVRSQTYDAVRHFITVGDDSFLRSRTKLDSRMLECADRVKDDYGPLFNFIYIGSDAAGRVIGHFTFYNVLGFQVVLAESGGSPDQSIGLVSNPLVPSAWSDEAAAVYKIRFDWLNRPEYDETFETQRMRVSDLIQTYYDRATPKELHRMVDSAFDKHGLGENDPIPEELAGKISSEISARIAAHTLHHPFEELITPEQLRAALSGRDPPRE